MPIQDTGVVVIGRNEGARLQACLSSLVGRTVPIVYVDSGSTDGSIALAQSFGITVIELDRTRPFTAARARNAGFSALLETQPALKYTQFVDGDCSVVGGWLEHARMVLEDRDEMAIVCGYRREGCRSASIYNRLCDMEWNGPAGETKRICGDMMSRAEAFRAVGGFREDLIAGEEADLCVRLCNCGWAVVRIEHEMTTHDANIHRFGQWWRRATRAGHAYAEGAWIHASTKERHNLRPLASIAFWAFLLPALAIALVFQTTGLSLLLFGGYAALWVRIHRKRRSGGDAAPDASLYATFCILGKFAELVGVIWFLWRRVFLRRPSGLIEYKGPGRTPTTQDASTG